jgi:hypothetical protein
MVGLVPGFFCNREAPILNSRALLCLLLFIKNLFFRQLLLELREAALNDKSMRHGGSLQVITLKQKK